MNTKRFGLNCVVDGAISSTVVVKCTRPNDGKRLNPRCGVFLNTGYLAIRASIHKEPWASIRREVL